jgi:glycerol-3-phosphate dehydrogenase (NAD(P)+)
LPEGIAAAKHVRTLAEKYHIKMPISDGVYQILDKQISPAEYLHSIFKRNGQ